MKREKKNQRQTDLPSVRLYRLLPMGILWLMFLGIVCVAGMAVAADSPDSSRKVIDAESQWEFAETLFSEGRWEEAELEYRRWLHLFPRNENVESALLKVGISLFRQGRFEEAAGDLKKLIGRYPASDPRLPQPVVEGYWLTVECLIRMGRQNDGALLLNNLVNFTPVDAIRDEARYRLGWLLMEQGHIDKAQEVFAKISAEGSHAYRIDELIAAMEPYSSLPEKNPGVAGALSILPGLGQIYCGRYHDAMIAAVINGLMMAATWEAFDSDNVSLGIGLGLLATGFYSGNIYNAVSSANKFNRNQRRQFMDRLKVRFYLGRQNPDSSRSLMLNFSLAF